MGLATRILTTLGVQADSRQTIAPNANQAPSVLRYDWLKTAIGNALLAHAQEDIEAHLSVAEDEIWQLQRIFLRSENSATRALIHRFCEQFNNEKRVVWLQKHLNILKLPNIDYDTLMSLDQDSHEMLQTELPTSHFAWILAEASTHEVGIDLIGEFVTKPKLSARVLAPPPQAIVPEPAPMPIAEPLPVPTFNPIKSTIAPSISNDLIIPIHHIIPEDSKKYLIDITDAQGEKALKLTASKGSFGRASEPSIQGEFVSGTHFQWEMMPDGHSMMICDVSRNGVFAQNGRLTPNQPTILALPCLIRLGAGLADGGLSHAQAPQILWHSPEVEVVTPTSALAVSATPIRVIAPTTPKAQPTLKIECVTPDQQWRVEIPAQFPFKIGRAVECALRLPEQNAAVSRVHLQVLRQEKAGLWIQNLGSRGSYVRGIAQAEAFLILWEQLLILGGAHLEAEHAPVGIRFNTPLA